MRKIHGIFSKFCTKFSIYTEFLRNFHWIFRKWIFTENENVYSLNFHFFGEYSRNFKGKFTEYSKIQWKYIMKISFSVEMHCVFSLYFHVIYMEFTWKMQNENFFFSEFSIVNFRKMPHFFPQVFVGENKIFSEKT